MSFARWLSSLDRQSSSPGKKRPRPARHRPIRPSFEVLEARELLSVTASGTTVRATEGQALTGTVATFTDSNKTDQPSDFSSVISWGDGGSSNGTIIATASGRFSVQGIHTYAEEGTNPLRVTITLIPGGRQATANGTSIVTDAALTAGALTPPTATEGQPFQNSQLFHFADANPEATASDLTATITWGDGSTSTVTSTAAADGQIVASTGGGFGVLGSHTYAEQLSGKRFAVSVHDVGGRRSAPGSTRSRLPMRR